MPAKRRDRTGETGDFFEVIERIERADTNGERQTYWACRCTANGPDCAGRFEVANRNLKPRTSCGCKKRLAKDLPLEKQFTTEQIQTVVSLRRAGEIRESADGIRYRLKRKPHYVVAKELGMSEADVKRICADEFMDEREKLAEKHRRAYAWKDEVILTRREIKALYDGLPTPEYDALREELKTDPQIIEWERQQEALRAKFALSRSDFQKANETGNLISIDASADFGGVIDDVSAAADDEPRLLYDRKEAARQLSISIRSLDYLIAAKKFNTRRVGKKVLIPRGELIRFSRADHPESVTDAA